MQHFIALESFVSIVVCTVRSSVEGGLHAMAENPGSTYTSPEPGTFPKRRPTAGTRLTVDTGDCLPVSGAPAISSCRSDSAGVYSPLVSRPPSSASNRRLPRFSKPGYQAQPAIYNVVVSTMVVVLLVIVAGTATYKQRRLAAVVNSAEQKHQVGCFEPLSLPRLGCMSVSCIVQGLSASA